MDLADARDEFYSGVERELGFSKEKTQFVLKQQFVGGFSIDKISKYMVVLRNYRAKEIELEERQLEAEKNRVVQPPYPLCPRCGAELIPDLRWHGRFTKKPGWVCSSGGLTHFLEWKANEVRRKQGLEPVFSETHPDPVFPYQSVLYFQSRNVE